MFNFLIILFQLATCYWIGSLFNRDIADIRLRLVSGVYAGMGIIATLLFFILWKYPKFFDWYCYLILAIGIFYLAVKNKKILQYLIEIKKELSRIDFLVFGIVLLYIPSLLAPPVAADSLAYHFLIPKLYSQSKALVYDPSFYFHMPHIFELFTSISYFFLGSISLKALYFLNLIFLIVLIYFIADHILKEKFLGSLAAIVILLTPMIIQIGSSGHIEVLMAVLTTTIFIIIYMILSKLQEPSASIFSLIGILAGILICTKYYGFIHLISILLIGIVLYLTGFNRPFFKKNLVFFIIFTTISFFAVSTIFYLKNFYETSLLFFPKNYFKVIPTGISEELIQVIDLNNAVNKRPLGLSFNGAFDGIYSIFFDGKKLDGGINGLGPIVLLFIYPVFALFFNRRTLNINKQFIFLGSFFIAAGYTLWFILAFQRLRHLIPMYPVLIICLLAFVPVTFENVKNHRINKVIYSLPIIIFITYGLIAAVTFFKNDFKSLIYHFDEDQYLIKYQPISYEIKKITNSLPSDAKIITTFGSYRFYHSRHNYYLSPFFQSHYDFTSINSAEELLLKFKGDGITHILYSINTSNKQSESQYESKLWNIFGGLIAKYTENCSYYPIALSASLSLQDYSMKDLAVMCSVKY